MPQHDHVIYIELPNGKTDRQTDRETEREIPLGECSVPWACVIVNLILNVGSFVHLSAPAHLYLHSLASRLLTITFAFV